VNRISISDPCHPWSREFGCGRRLRWFTLSLILAAAAVLALPPSPSPLPASAADSAAIEVYFSPRGGALEALVREIHAAKASIFVQAYSFTSEPIARALIAAHGRGVKVAVILDKSKIVEEKRSQARVVAGAGIRVLVDDSHRAAHNKLTIIDDSVVVTGSYNYTSHSEEENAENLLVIRDRPLAGKYLANWKAHEAHAQPY
jgi:phosphatidylserine/phosphatidylglycerophosphate/cardiolipin synthase-like enzyme